MDAEPRQQLSYIITQYGRSICDDPRRLEALLKDLAGAHKREINALMAALRERIPNDLMQANPALPKAALMAQLAGRLHSDLAYAEDAARWAVEAWAVALGVLTEAEAQAMQPAVPPPPVFVPPVPSAPTPAAPTPNRGPVQNAPWQRPAQPPAPPYRPPVPPARRAGWREVIYGVGGILFFVAVVGYRVSRMFSHSAAYNSPTINAYTPSRTVNVMGTNWPGAQEDKSPATLPVRTIDAPHNIGAFAFSPDKRFVAIGTGYDFETFDAHTGEKQHTLVVPSLKKKPLTSFYDGKVAVAISPDGQHIATGAGDGTIRLWNAATGAQEHALETPRVGVTDFDLITRQTSHYTEASGAGDVLAFSPDSKTLVTDGGSNNKLLLWDVPTGRLRHAVAQAKWFSHPTFSPDGKTLVTLVQSANMIQVRDAQTGKVLRSVKLEDSIKDVAFSPEGQQLAINRGSSGYVAFLDVQTLKQQRKVKASDAWNETLTFTPDGKSLLLSGGRGVYLAGADSGSIARKLAFRKEDRFAVQDTVDRAFLSKDGTMAAAGGNGGSMGANEKKIYVWQLSAQTAQNTPAASSATPTAAGTAR